MPPLVTSRSGNSVGPTKSFSRLTSFKRDWDDDVPQENGRGLKGASSQVEWSPSPERVKRKGVIPPTMPSPQMMNPNETAADRRRRAIRAAMAQTSEPSTYSSASTPALASTSTSTYNSSMIRPSVLRTPPVQELPSLPSAAAMTTLKRELPWQEDFTTAKKAMARTDSAASSKTTTKRSGSASSIKPTIDIKQKIVLSSEQQKVLSLVVQEGKNIFFTGSAGTGKSVLLREIIKSLRKKYATSADAVAVTASTGIAACNIGGVTLHSFGGVGLGIEKPDILAGKVRKNKKAAARWLRTKVLIIDEVSMVDGELFDKFCKIGQMLRKNPGKPWGGIQIIVTGDFFQLPPVTKGGGMPKFCFEAQTWDETINMSVNLTKVFRQKDPRFIDMLNEMRFGKLSPQSIAAFKALSRPIHYDDGIDPTELFPRREDVERSNLSRLNMLNTNGWSYVATDGGAVTDPIQREKLLGNFIAPQSIMLKVDAQVMLIKNMDETLVNGSMGKIIGFCHKPLYFTDAQGRWREDPEDEYEDEEAEKARRVRVALSLKIEQNAKPSPVVQFKVPGGGLRDMLIEADVFKAELPNGEVQASRSQLPLILAWAMSIHKSQGQTLERVKVDLGKVFEKGQAYVALSRATSLEGLQVMGFTADKVMAHRKVITWSQSLRDLNL